MQLVGLPTRAVPGKGIDDSCGYTPVANTQTRCCCGLFSAKVGMQLVLACTLVDGLWHVFALLSDRGQEHPVFRWGPPGYEVYLQVASALVGLVSIAVGLAGLAATQQLQLRGIRRVTRYLRLNILWTAVWFVLVGLPVHIVYIEVPATVWPVSLVPGMPTTLLLDPDWPEGQPSICTDATDIKSRLTQTLTENKKKAQKRWVKRLLKKLYTMILKKVLPCDQVVTVFWSYMLFVVAAKMYFVYTSKYFYRVVEHGGDGNLMIGSIGDAESMEGMTVEERMQAQIKDMFDKMDANQDGRVSLEELMDYLQNNSSLYRRVRQANP